MTSVGTISAGIRALALTAVAIVTFPVPGPAQTPLGEAESVLAALNGGRGGVHLRYRLEYVDQDGFDKDAWASTLRTAVRYQTMQYRRFDLYLDVVDVSNIGDDAYNSTANGRVEYPIVPDPAVTRMNQAFFRWSHGEGAATFGRQELLFDNARFIGNVGWRQTHQSFDAFRADWSSLEWLEARYTYADRVLLVLGRDLSVHAHLVNLDLDAGAPGRLRAYAYLLDYRDEPALALSSNTFGAAWTAERDLPWESWKVDGRAEYAAQHDAYDNPERIRADYVHLLAVIGRPVLGLRVGWERLSGSAEDGQFSTPLATLHKFNGWADRFLITPDDGLKDLYVTLAGKRGKVTYEGTWHDFRAENGGAAYGSELDALVSYRTDWNQTLALKAAWYTADGFSVDTTKIWAYTSFGFQGPGQ